MSQRKVRVGELLRSQLSDALHTKWRAESVGITLTHVDVAPDLRTCNIYYSVIGGREEAARAIKFLLSIRSELRFMMGREVTLKYTPSLNFVYDASIAKGMRVLDILDELDSGGDAPAHDDDEEDPYES